MIDLRKGDCLELMRDIPDKSIDAIIADLPYGTTKLKWDLVIPFEELWMAYKRVIKENGAIVLFAGEPFTSRLICSNINQFRERLTWEKHKPSNIGNAKHMHLKYSEDIVIFSSGTCTYNPQMQPRKSDRVRQAQKGNSKQWRSVGNNSSEVCFTTMYEPKNWKHYNADFKYPGNVITMPSVVSNSKEKVNHPTQKPVALLEYLIKTYTNEGEMVLDNTMGSGTTGVACINTNRNFIGMELDDKYFEIAKARINEATTAKQLTLF